MVSLIHNYLPKQYEDNDKLTINHNYLKQQFKDAEKILLDIKKLIKKGDYTLGEAVDEIEEEFKKITNCKYALGVGSRTDAITLSLKAIDIKKDELLEEKNQAKRKMLKIEIMELEDIGFIKKGNGAEYVRTLFNTEDKKINPRGGLIGSGHPLGATGIAQTIEITEQLQNGAGKKQITNAKRGLVHNMSAAATSSSVLVLES